MLTYLTLKELELSKQGSLVLDTARKLVGIALNYKVPSIYSINELS